MYIINLHSNLGG